MPRQRHRADHAPTVPQGQPRPDSAIRQGQGSRTSQAIAAECQAEGEADPDSTIVQPPRVRHRAQGDGLRTDDPFWAPTPGDGPGSPRANRGQGGGEDCAGRANRGQGWGKIVLEEPMEDRAENEIFGTKFAT